MQEGMIMKRSLVLAFLAAVPFVYFAGCRLPILPAFEEPSVVIDEPPPQHRAPEIFGEIIEFGWRSGTDIDPRYVRYLFAQVVDTNGVYSPGFDIVADLNENPRRYEERWSEWIPYKASNNDGRSVTIGDDEVLDFGYHYIFAVQARGMGTPVTETFESGRNARIFMPVMVQGPILLVGEQYIGAFRFLGTKLNPQTCEFPPGVPFNFRWRGDASGYGGTIVSYRYGWDIRDLGNPGDWAVPRGPDYTSAPERTLSSGVHTFYVEAVDNLGKATLAQIMIEVVPFSMHRNLLWVDDFYASTFQPPLYEMPSESRHDEFWIASCSRAEGFVPDRDVYDVFYDNGKQPPAFEEIGKYKNIIWTYSSSNDAWKGVIEYTSESMIASTYRNVNSLSIFVMLGGHLWTLGRSEKGSGLAAVFKPPMLPLMPASIAEEIVYDPADASGKLCMPYRDYCVTVLDKVWGTFKPVVDLPGGIIRNMDRDALIYAVRDGTDPINDQYPDLPLRLDLWDEVMKPGRFFDPQVRGFIYVEAYDPEYYMEFTFHTSQGCFAPMYRMRTRSTLSPLRDATIAIWVRKYDSVIPDVQSGIAVAARSVHFGFPLWFFDPSQVDKIVGVVFEEWGILAEP